MGGAGDAFPASIASLMYPATLAAMTTRPRAPALATHASPRPTTALAKKASREKTLLASPSARDAIGVAEAARREEARARVATGATPVGAVSPRAMFVCALRLSVLVRTAGVRARSCAFTSSCVSAGSGGRSRVADSRARARGRWIDHDHDHDVDVGRVHVSTSIS